MIADTTAQVFQPSNMPPDQPIRRVDFVDFDEIKRTCAEAGEVKYCRCMRSKNFPYCDGSHVRLNNEGISNAGPLVVKANPPNIKEAACDDCTCSGPRSNMPSSNPVRRVDFADIEELVKLFEGGGEKKYCRCFKSKAFPYCDGSHVELNKQGISNAGPLVIKAKPPAPTAADATSAMGHQMMRDMVSNNALSKVAAFENGADIKGSPLRGAFANLPAPSNSPVVQYSDAEQLNKQFAQAKKHDIITSSAFVPKVQESWTPWGTIMPEICEEARSGNGTLEMVGVNVSGNMTCQGCKQKFSSEKIQQLHWKFMHEFNI